MTKTSKAARIRNLYAEGKTTTEIAGIVGCLPAYARAVKQRNESGDSDTNRRWREKNAAHIRAQRRKRFKKLYRTNPAFRARHLGYQKRARDEARA